MADTRLMKYLESYTVREAGTGELVDECFVLRPDRDLDARVALRAYAAATEDKAMAADICAWAGPVIPMTREQVLEYCEAMRPVYVKHLRRWALPTMTARGMLELRFASGAWLLVDPEDPDLFIEYSYGFENSDRYVKLYPAEVAD